MAEDPLRATQPRLSALQLHRGTIRNNTKLNVVFVISCIYSYIYSYAMLVIEIYVAI